jgi:malic enzyme
VPPRTLSLAVQVEKMLLATHSKATALEKHSFLSELQDRNETLYFRLLIDNLEALAPIIYTPTVGLACQKFGSVFRRARGMYFSSQDKGLLGTMCYNWPHDDVEVIVVTDGSRILGLGAWVWREGVSLSLSRARARACSHLLRPPCPPPRRRPGRQWHGHPHWQAGAVRGGGRH